MKKKKKKEKNDKRFRKDFRRFFGMYKDCPGMFWRSIFYRLIRSSFVIANIYLLKEFVNFLELWNKEKFLHYIIVYFVIFIIYLILRWFTKNWAWSEMFFENIRVLQSKYMSKFLHLDNNDIEKIGSGKLVSTINTGIESWADWVRQVLDASIDIVLSLWFTAFMIYQMWTWYFGGFLFLTIFVVLLMQIIIKKSFSIRKKRIILWHERTRKLVKIIMSKFEILINHKWFTEITLLNDNVKDQKSLNRKQNNYRYLSSLIPQLMVFCLRILVFFVVWYWVFSGDYSLSQFVVLMAVVAYADSVFWQFRVVLKNHAKAWPKIERMRELFDNTPDMKWVNEGKKFVFKKWDIRFENLNYDYSENKVFKDLNLEIKWGKKTALVGISGGWKSTIVKLIAWYLHPDGWKLWIDGQDMSKIALKSYYKHIGYLTQDPSVFDGTIQENLSYALKKLPNEKDIKHILKLAKCDFVFDLPNGLDTEIGERWVRLSGGQKQRLAIAKIFLKDPEIILLDEPTSALDSVSEQKITEALHNLFENRTVIVIAHRLQTVKASDEIIVIWNGEILERWNHNSLKNIEGGVYAEMFNLQTRF